MIVKYSRPSCMKILHSMLSLRSHDLNAIIQHKTNDIWVTYRTSECDTTLLKHSIEATKSWMQHLLPHRNSKRGWPDTIRKTKHQMGMQWRQTFNCKHSLVRGPFTRTLYSYAAQDSSGGTYCWGFSASNGLTYCPERTVARLRVVEVNQGISVKIPVLRTVRF